MSSLLVMSRSADQSFFNSSQAGLMNPFEILQSPREVLESVEESDWRELVESLLKELKSHLGCQIRTKPLKDWSLGAGFCIEISEGRYSIQSPVFWKGILGATIIEDRLWVSLTKFLYYDNQRLITRQGKEFADYVYKQNEEGNWCWQLFGWFEDEYEEYEYFDEP
ncbi:MAG: hypothetical protein R3C11_14620 [Planctomycetaceae bacterium]